MTSMSNAVITGTIFICDRMATFCLTQTLLILIC